MVAANGDRPGHDPDNPRIRRRRPPSSDRDRSAPTPRAPPARTLHSSPDLRPRILSPLHPQGNRPARRAGASPESRRRPRLFRLRRTHLRLRDPQSDLPPRQGPASAPDHLDSRTGSGGAAPRRHLHRPSGVRRIRLSVRLLHLLQREQQHRRRAPVRWARWLAPLPIVQDTTSSDSRSPLGRKRPAGYEVRFKGHSGAAIDRFVRPVQAGEQREGNGPTGGEQALHAEATAAAGTQAVPTATEGSRVQGVTGPAAYPTIPISISMISSRTLTAVMIP